jgi:mannose-6-phosphate isomerase-like protein (cupin superfamily)
MSETAFLSGRVIRRRLPEYVGPPPADAPALKRLRLPQGDLVQFHNDDEGMRYVAWIELKEGGVRGNHYHERKLEHIYLLTGAVELTVEDIDTGERAVVDLEAGDRVTIPTRIAHALRTVRAGQAVEFSPGRLESNDTFRRPLV